jgi:hypothetical protein
MYVKLPYLGEVTWDLYDVIKDESVKVGALKLIEAEDDRKYRKKYAKL